MTTARSSEILFIKCVKDGIPNRDPLNESDARRIFGEDDGRISLSDVSIKRDVRDYILARFPEGGSNKNNFIFCREEYDSGNKLLGRKSLANSILNRAGKTVDSGKAEELEAEETEGEEEVKKGKKGGKKGKIDILQKKRDLLEVAFDARIFGLVYSVEKEKFNQVGPVQFGWAHSLHPVETKYVQGTTVMPSSEKDQDGGKSGDEKEQGTIWRSFILPFAIFAMPGIINASIAKNTGMTEEDVDLLLKGLWWGTQQRQARGRGTQQPLFLMHVEYKDPFFRIGFLEDYIKIKPGWEEWLGGNPPSSLPDVSLDISPLAELLGKNKNEISRIRLACNEYFTIEGNIEASQILDLKELN
jgi:CRISPR-associated protein Csh2